MELLKVEHLSKQIKKYKIINDVSLTIKSGEVVGLIGPNGSGKTSLMKLITGLYHLDSGELVLNNINQCQNFSDYMEQVGAIIENPVFYPNLTGKKCLDYYAEIRMVNKKQVQKVIHSMGLVEIMNQKIKTYSLGNLQRLGIAQALLNNPQLLILDEPFNGLDPDGIFDLKQIILAQKNQGKGILISSHTLPELQQICDKFIFFKSGEIVKELTSEEIEATSYSILTIDSENLLLASNVLFENRIKNFELVSGNIYLKEKTQDEVLDIMLLLRSNGVSIITVENKFESLQDNYEKVISGGDK